MWVFIFIELPDENIEGVFEAAHLFQYDKICHYITEELPVIPRNCISLLKLSELYSLYELNAKALNYIIPNFSKVILF